MSDGAKIGLILGGTAVVAYFLFFRTSAATPLAATSTTTAGAPLGQSPGAPQSTGVATAVKSGLGGLAGLATIGPSAIAKVGSTFYNIDKKVLGGAVGAAKSVVSSATSVVSSGFHDVLSIF